MLGCGIRTGLGAIVIVRGRKVLNKKGDSGIICVLYRLFFEERRIGASKT
jgi:hypothetical protein